MGKDRRVYSRLFGLGAREVRTIRGVDAPARAFYQDFRGDSRGDSVMHMRHSDTPHGPEIVPVKFILEDPHGLTGGDQREHNVLAGKGEHLLEVAMEAGINIEHACGGVCACSTCHVYIEKGMDQLSEATEAEEDRVEEAPGLQRNSRLSCQCEVVGEGPIVVRVPAWNRNAVKEVPH